MFVSYDPPWKEVVIINENKINFGRDYTDSDWFLSSVYEEIDKQECVLLKSLSLQIKRTNIYRYLVVCLKIIDRKQVFNLLPIVS